MALAPWEGLVQGSASFFCKRPDSEFGAVGHVVPGASDFALQRKQRKENSQAWAGPRPAELRLRTLKSERHINFMCRETLSRLFVFNACSVSTSGLKNCACAHVPLPVIPAPTMCQEASVRDGGGWAELGNGARRGARASARSHGMEGAT